MIFDIKADMDIITTRLQQTKLSQSSRLLSLPPKLRNMIYGYAVQEDKVIDVTRSKMVRGRALFEVCKKIRHGARLTYFAVNTFRIRVGDRTSPTLPRYIESLSQEECGAIGTLVVRYSYMILATVLNTMRFLKDLNPAVFVPAQQVWVEERRDFLSAKRMPEDAPEREATLAHWEKMYSDHRKHWTRFVVSLLVSGVSSKSMRFEHVERVQRCVRTQQLRVDDRVRTCQMWVAVVESVKSV
ncbi:hypothetical protein LTR78_000102 [Recurvomyces mirabilis]|uniref:Uncharacterized protein n=1 Tax=Recurvomyces mirabilis TaxID=574656 RepID=A0AAE0WXI7_9PEZI|nr:hypothetical protein LTR78_000102 [Recurvomyces mirabilis]KAK5161759.1 hypothetical protein LTS14_000104 [Recurvomyces mirabilis]